MSRAELTLPVGGKTIPIRFSSETVVWAAARISELLPGHPQLFIINDERVALLYENPLQESLQRHGFDVSATSFEPGEGHKNLRTFARLLDEMADRKLARDAVVIGLGGGIATDVAGFAASVYKRGIRWIAVPTTIMGMADAAIGGKTGVNHPRGKNLVGTFHQPLAVFAPLRVLDTLPEREWISGSAEVVKAALLAGGEFWQDVRRHRPNLALWPRDKVSDAIQRSAQVKVDIVAQDEKESGLRRQLNLGHTIGHAIEAATGYQRFLHGEAVFLGLRAAVALSHAAGLLNVSDSTELDDLLATVPLPAVIMEPATLMAALEQDKKIQDGGLQWVLLKSPGSVVITSEVSPEAVHKIAEWICQIASSGSPSTGQRKLRMLVLNGPNLNLLGQREPELYGNTSAEELELSLQSCASEAGIEVLVRQSNVEGDLVSLIQWSRHWADGIIINPGGFTHTSVAIRDALTAVTLPVIEVHLTDVAKREAFRQISLIEPVCRQTIAGRGIAGYIDAIEALKNLIGTPPPEESNSVAEQIHSSKRIT